MVIKISRSLYMKFIRLKFTNKNDGAANYD